MITQILVDAMKADSGIAALSIGGIYPKNLPDAPTYPNIVVSKISAPRTYDMDGDANIEEARVQVDVRALGYAEMTTLKEAVRRFITARPPPGPPCAINNARCINDFDSPAGNPEAAGERPGPRVRRRILEFTIWVVG